MSDKDKDDKDQDDTDTDAGKSSYMDCSEQARKRYRAACGGHTLWNWSLCTCGRYSPSAETIVGHMAQGLPMSGLPPPCCKHNFDDNGEVIKPTPRGGRHKLIPASASSSSSAQPQGTGTIDTDDASLPGKESKDVSDDKDGSEKKEGPGMP
jgi:hypothetical protein